MSPNQAQTDVNVKTDVNGKKVTESTNSKMFSGSIKNQNTFNYKSLKLSVKYNS